MTAVSISGFAALRKRFEARGLAGAVKETLRAEAEALAGDAARAAPGDLGRTVEVRDISQGERPAYAVGTPHPAGRFLEHGTARRPASPWLLPVLHTHLPRVRQSLRKVVAAALKGPQGEV